MHRPLREHILFLETKLQNLRDKLTDDSLPRDARAAILAQIQFATEAVDFYRRAFELEYGVATGDLSTPLTDSRPRNSDATMKINPPDPSSD